MKLRKTLAGILGAVVMLLGVGTFEHINKETGVHAADGNYVKVTTAPSDWSGDYLIVYEEGSKCFDGSLSSLDATSNFKAVTISNNEIEGSSTNYNYKFTIEKSGSDYTIQSASGYYIGSTSDKNQLLSNKSTQYTNTISLDTDGSVKIVGSGNTVLRYNATSGQDRFRYFKSTTYTSQKTIHLYKFEGTATECECSSFIEEETPSVTNLITDATCTESAVYKLVCSNCGKASENENDIYSYGDPLGHNYDELGLCTRCGNYNEDLSLDDRVTKLFAKYFNEGNYTKETYLNVNSTAMEEVGIYFHAEAIAPYRKTVYEPGKLSMVTANVEGEYDNETLSVYEDNGENVKHTGLGGNWTVNWTSVEDKFVTLKDFKESTITGWTYENGIYSFKLAETTATFEDNMTRMAREFVAPMWLAPNADNYSYLRFAKLTVEEDGAELVMKLFVNSGDASKLIDQSEYLFSQARISKGTTNLATLATFELGTNGGGTTESTQSKETYTETVNGYTLTLTGGSKMYPNSYDAKGNGTIKMGSSSAIGQFTFTVPQDVNKVVINVAGRTKPIDIDINGSKYSISTLATNGEYTAIEIDTTSTKTITFKTENTDNEYRCMINSIEYHA